MSQACDPVSVETRPSKTAAWAATGTKRPKKTSTPTRRFIPSRTPRPVRSTITVTGCLQDSSSINIRACGGTDFEVVGSSTSVKGIYPEVVKFEVTTSTIYIKVSNSGKTSTEYSAEIKNAQ